MHNRTPKTNLPSRAFTVREFGLVYGPGRSKTYELISEGKLTAVKVGAKTLISAESAEDWFTNLPRAQIGQRGVGVIE
ncbi:MAG: hypothetical protein HQ511_00205 [Rhodospirillales bacterium]|nr:hypothetical protein [Rhodospirillales bacterium]